MSSTARVEALREAAEAPDPTVSAPALYRLGNAYYDTGTRKGDDDALTEEGPRVCASFHLYTRKRLNLSPAGRYLLTTS